MKRKALLLIAAVLIMSLGLVFSVSAQETNDNIVDIIAKNGRLDTLHTAVVEAGLADTLASAGSSFTLFAPAMVISAPWKPPTPALPPPCWPILRAT